jgi:AP-3 complex subunit delta
MSTESTEPHFPKSLFLIQPLFSAYPLNPVASTAQGSVPVPEGLDLDKWIVAPPPPSSPVGDGVHDELGKVRKSKKSRGKDKEANGVVGGDKKKKKKVKRDGLPVRSPYEYDEHSGSGSFRESLTPVEVEETAEERAEKDRVGPLSMVLFF